MGLLEKFPGLIRPYVPNPEVDWEAASLESDVLCRFEQPEVAEEFRVYMHRDLVLLVLAVVFCLGSTFFGVSGVISLGDFIWPNLAAAGLSLVLGLADLYMYLNLPLTAQNAFKRRCIEVCLLFPWSWVLSVAPFVSYQVEKCKERWDYFAALGIPRPNQFTPQEWHWFCPGQLMTFSFACISIVFTTFPLPPVMIGVMYTYHLVMLVLCRFIVPNHDYEPGHEIATRVIFTLVVAALSFILVVMRYRNSMNSFRQAIVVKKQTLWAGKREADVDGLLCSMLPPSALDRMTKDQVVTDYTEEATVLFSDMVSFTAWSSTRSPQQVVAMLNVICIQIDELAVAKGVEKIKTIGDAYWAVTGLPTCCEQHAEVMCDFGNSMLEVIKAQNALHPEWNSVTLRTGIHSGPLFGGILGTQQLSYEVWGDTSRIAEQVEKLGVPRFVCVTTAVLERIGVDPAVLGPTVGEIEKPESKKGSSTEDQLPPGVSGGEAESSSVFQIFSLQRQPVSVMVTLSQKRKGDSKTTAMFAAIRESVVGEGAKDRKKELQFSVQLEETKSRRTQFLNQRRAKPAALPGKGGKKKDRAQAVTVEEEAEDTLESVTAKYSKRRWNWVLEEFADPQVEAEYFQFVQQKHRSLAAMCRAATLVICFLMVLCTLFPLDGQHPLGFGNFTLGSLISYILGILMLAGDLVIGAAFARKEEQQRQNERHLVAKAKPTFGVPHLRAILHHLSCFVMLIAGGLATPGVSIATNDVNWLAVSLTFLLSWGSIGFVSSATLAVVNVSALIPLTTVLTWNRPMLPSHFMFFLLAEMTILFTLVIIEKQYRSNFLHLHVAEYFKRGAQQRNYEQELLLEAMVPPHVVPRLMVWMQEDHLDPLRTLVSKYDQIVVGFIQIYSPENFVGKSATKTGIVMGRDEERPSLGGSGPREAVTGPTTVASTVQSVDAVQVFDADAEVPEVQQTKEVPPVAQTVVPPEQQPRQLKDLSEGDLDLLGKDGPTTAAPSSLHEGQSTVMTGTGNTEGGDEGNGALSYKHWVQQVHADIDNRILSHFRAIDKIKTVGDVIMVAGPFTYFTVAEAIDELLAATAAIQDVAVLRAGFHVGEIVAAVLGTNRLSFDIFGDTVNVASRTMTSGASREVHLSQAVRDVVEAEVASKPTADGEEVATLILSQRGTEIEEKSQPSRSRETNPLESVGSIKSGGSSVDGIPRPVSSQRYLCQNVKMSPNAQVVEAKGKGSIQVYKVDHLPRQDYLDVDVEALPRYSEYSSSIAGENRSNASGGSNSRATLRSQRNASSLSNSQNANNGRGGESSRAADLVVDVRNGIDIDINTDMTQKN